MSFGTPDVCLTPVGPVVVPIPYPNFGPHAMAATFSVIVKAAMIPALNLASVVALTTGDEPGVAHWTVKGPGTFDMGSPIVMVEKIPGINLTSQTNGNTGNDQPGMVITPGAPNVLYTFAAEDASAERAVEKHQPPCERLNVSPVCKTNVFEETADNGKVVRVGYVKVAVFSLALPSQVIAFVEELNAPDSLVIDLQDCPGGELLAAAELLRLFLPAGTRLFTVSDAEGDDVEYESHNAYPIEVPLVVLVNEKTASAAEVFANSIIKNQRGVVLGGPTYGKNVVGAFDGAEGRTYAVGTVK